MIKKIFFVILVLFVAQPSMSFASESKEITLHVQFDSGPNAYGQPIHINKVIKISPIQKLNNIVMTQSEIVNNFPVTTAMLVKFIEMNNNQITLQFNLVNYGFKQGGNIYTQPRVVLLNQHEGKVQNEAFKLKVSANWNALAT